MKESKERNRELLKRKYDAATYPINENIEYPYNGKVLIQGLLGEIKKLRDDVDSILPPLRQKEEK